MIKLESHLKKHISAVIGMVHELDILSPQQFKQFQSSLKTAKHSEPLFEVIFSLYEAKIHLLEGNLVKANNLATLYFLRLSNPSAYELIQYPKVMALIGIELSIIFLQASDYKLAYMAIELASKEIKHKKLSLLIDVQFEFLKIVSTSSNALKPVQKLLNDVLNEGLVYHYIFFQLNLIQYCFIDNQTKTIKRSLETIQLLNKNISYFYFSEASNIINAKIRLLPSNTLSTNQYLTNLQSAIESPFKKTEAHILSSQIHFMNSQYLLGMTSLKKAENLALEYGLSQALPRIYFLMAKALKDGFSAHEWVVLFLEQAKEVILKQQKNGLNISGARLDIIKYYNRYLKERDVSHKDFSFLSRYFSFAEGNSWKELKQTFQYNTFMHLALSGKKWPGLLDVIKLNASTFHTIKYKLRDAGYVIPKIVTKETLQNNTFIKPGLQSYISMNLPIIWERFSQQFENDMMYYMLIKNGSEKVKLAQAMGLSYPIIIAKTKFLEIDSTTLSNQKQHEFDAIIALIQ